MILSNWRSVNMLVRPQKGMPWITTFSLTQNGGNLTVSCCSYNRQQAPHTHIKDPPPLVLLSLSTLFNSSQCRNKKTGSPFKQRKKFPFFTFGKVFCVTATTTWKGVSLFHDPDRAHCRIPQQRHSGRHNEKVHNIIRRLKMKKKTRQLAVPVLFCRDGKIYKLKYSSLSRMFVNLC